MASGIKQDIKSFQESYQRYEAARTSWRRESQDPVAREKPFHPARIEMLFRESLAAYETCAKRGRDLLRRIPRDSERFKQIAALMANVTKLRQRQGEGLPPIEKGFEDITRELWSDSLTELDLSNHKFRDCAAKTKMLLTGLIGSSTSLTFLNLADNYLHKEVGEVKQIADVIRHNTSIVAIDLTQNYIKGEGARELVRALQSNSTLTWLKLKCNDLSSLREPDPDLRKVLLSHPTLTWLSLQANFFLDGGSVRDLTEPLGSNTVLISLDLRSNSFTNQDAADLAVSLASNTTLTSLNLSWNQIMESGVEDLAQSLHSNTTLRTLKLNSNPCSYSLPLRALNNMYDFNTTVWVGCSSLSPHPDMYGFNKPVMIPGIGYFDPQLLIQVIEKGERNRSNRYLREVTLVQLLLSSPVLVQPT